MSYFYNSFKGTMNIKLCDSDLNNYVFCSIIFSIDMSKPKTLKFIYPINIYKLRLSFVIIVTEK